MISPAPADSPITDRRGELVTSAVSEPRRGDPSELDEPRSECNAAPVEPTIVVGRSLRGLTLALAGERAYVGRTDAVEHDAVIAAVRARLQADGRIGTLQTITADALRAVESSLGFGLPDLIRGLYLALGDGGFGPGHGLLGLTPAAERAESNEASAPELYAAFIQGDPGDPIWRWPIQLLPICDWGCSIYSCLDCSSPGARVVTFDPNARGPNEPMDAAFAESHASAGAWLLDWAEGVNLWAQMFEDDFERARLGINPFTKQPMVYRVQKLRRPPSKSGAG